MLGWRYAELYFGIYGRLRISDLLADRLWQTIPQSWPEKGVPEAVTTNRVFRYYFLQWLILTTIASAFFIIAHDRGLMLFHQSSRSSDQSDGPEGRGICISGLR